MSLNLFQKQQKMYFDKNVGLKGSVFNTNLKRFLFFKVDFNLTCSIISVIDEDGPSEGRRVQELLKKFGMYEANMRLILSGDIKHLRLVLIKPSYFKTRSRKSDFRCQSLMFTEN